MSMMFWGASAVAGAAGPHASIDNRTTSAFNISPSSASAYYRLHADGQVYAGAGPSVVETWRDVGSNPDFEVRATHVSGSTPTGTYGSWLALTSTRDWILGRSTVGTSSGVVDFEIRNASTLAVLDTARITFSVTVDSGM